MNPTVPFPVSEVPVKDTGIVAWINGEAQKLLRQMRAALNFVGADKKSADTAGDGSFVRIWTSTGMPANSAWAVVANVSGISTSGAAQRASYGFAGTFEATETVAAQVGSSTALWSHESAGAIDARFGVDAAARTVYLEARDDGASPMRFTAVVAVNEA